MATYLLVWNPERFGSGTTTPELWEHIGLTEDRQLKWSCGNTKRIKIDDRIFFIRLGHRVRGLFASGKAVSDSFEDMHWDPEKARRGNTCQYVTVALDTIPMDVDAILPYEILINEPGLAEMNWSIQRSGIRIPENVVHELELMWREYATPKIDPLPEEVVNPRWLNEGSVRRISVNRYERSARARAECISHHGDACAICGFSFRCRYGEVGSGLIHVHHLKPLSETGEDYVVDPIHDLIPVCPNCHAIIHRKEPPYTIDEVQLFLQ